MIVENPIHNYTGHGWEGHKYDSNLSTKEVAKIVRDELKRKYPECKFSVSFQSFSGGSEIQVYLMSAPFQVFTAPDMEACRNSHGYGTPESKFEGWKNTMEKGITQLNPYYLKDDYTITEKTKEVMLDTRKLVNSYNFDDSDGQIDHFHTNFYSHFGIGKFEKPFILK